MVTANGTGFSQTNGGVIRSYGNNTVDNNSNNGAATGPTLGCQRTACRTVGS